MNIFNSFIVFIFLGLFDVKCEEFNTDINNDFTIINKEEVVKNSLDIDINVDDNIEKLKKTLRIFFSLGLVLDPTVYIHKDYIKEETYEDFEVNSLSGVKFGFDYIPTNVINNYIGFIRKYKIFLVKLKKSLFFSFDDLKNDYSNFIFGLQGEVGISLPLNVRYDKLIFNNDNEINKTVHSLNFLFGIKSELGSIEGGFDYIKKVYPTKLVVDVMYMIDIRKYFSFYINCSFFQCFSPVYLLSFNIDDLKKVLNMSNKFQWNIDVNIGIIGLNFNV